MQLISGRLSRTLCFSSSPILEAKSSSPHGRTSHESDLFLDEALTHHVTLHVLPPQSSDKTQALDLGLFGITKQALTKVRPDSEKSAQTNQLIRMLSAWDVAATPRNIVGSFRRSGIVVRWQEDRGALLAEVVPQEADHAQELSLHDHEEDETDDELDDLVANPESTEKIDRGTTKTLHESPLSRQCVESVIGLAASKYSSRQLPVSIDTRSRDDLNPRNVFLQKVTR
jgi:hypothetical protein